MRALLLTLSLLLATSAAAADRIPGPVQATVVECYDGDTCTVDVQPWPGDRRRTDVRFDGLNTPEIKGRCPEAGRAARDHLQGLVAGQVVVLTDIQPDKYGKRRHAFPVRARVSTAAGQDVAAIMIAAGLAQEYHGRGKADWCPPP